MAATFELYDGSTTIDLYNATNYRLRRLTFGIAPADTTLAGLSLRGYRYKPRLITANIHITDTSVANLLTDLRAVEDMLNVAKTRQINGHGTIVVLKTQVGDTNDDDIEYRVLSGTVRPTGILNEPALTSGELPAAELRIVAEPLGRLAAITHTALTLENEVDSNANFVDLLGPFNGYAVFDAAGEEIKVTDDAAIQDAFDGGGTVEAWIYAKSDGENNVGIIVSKGDGTADNWRLHVHSESGGAVKLRWVYEFSGTDGSWTTDDAVITLNKWHRASVEYDNSGTGNDPIISVDGVAKDITESATPTGTRATDVGSDLLIGDDEQSVGTFDGYVDDVRLWSDTRTQTEILANWHKELVGDEAGLVGYWPLNDSAGAVAKDSTSNGNDGTITGATFGIDDAQRSGDEEALLNIKLYDANNGGGNAWNDTDRKIWIWKRSGERRTDTLFYQAPDATIEGDPPISAEGAFTSPAGLTTNASGGTSQAARWQKGAGSTRALSASRIDCGYFRYDLAGGSIPAGLFRVLARVSVEWTVAAGPPVIADFDFALGSKSGALTNTPVLADDVAMAGSAEDEWHTLDLGSIVLPLTSVPDGFTEPTQEIRIHCIWNRGSTVNTDEPEYIEWAIDFLQLVPADEGLVIVDAVGTDDRVLSDGQTDRPGVYILDTSDVVQNFATFTGAPFPLGLEPTRVGWLRDDTGNPATIQAIVLPAHIPQLTGY